MSIESLLAIAILGQTRAFLTMSDAYKWAMAQAGFPLREETFVLTFRKGGPFFIPLDLKEVVEGFIPQPPSVKELAFLTANGYGMTPAMEKALTMPLKIWAAPKGSWVGKGEPILTITGPSFLVSWLEALCIMLSYPIQIAGAMRMGIREFTSTCEDQTKIIQLIAQQANLDPIIISLVDYKSGVTANVKAIVNALDGDAHRGFEVGLRGAVCMQQHLMALEVCRSFGLLKTSNVYGAWKLYMIPVGTTGHEHQMRWGGEHADDRNGYRAIRDMRPEPPSYLFDTTNALGRGIPGALEVLAETPNRPCSFRFDSGDQDAQFLAIKDGLFDDALEGVPFPNLIFEDSYTAEKTVKNEAFCEEHHWDREKRMYGYGGYIVSQPAQNPYSRDAVSAAYKLSCTNGRAVMKISSPGKESIPGKPVLLEKWESDRLKHLIAQEGEQVPGYSSPIPRVGVAMIDTEFSPQTLSLKNSILKGVASYVQ